MRHLATSLQPLQNMGFSISPRIFPLFHFQKFQGQATGTSVQSNITLAALTVVVAKGCTTDFPQMEMNEECNIFYIDSRESLDTIGLTPNDTVATLIAAEVWGALRGLESFSQMIFKGDNNVSLDL